MVGKSPFFALLSGIGSTSIVLLPPATHFPFTNLFLWVNAARFWEISGPRTEIFQPYCLIICRSRQPVRVKKCQRVIWHPRRWNAIIRHIWVLIVENIKSATRVKHTPPPQRMFNARKTHGKRMILFIISICNTHFHWFLVVFRGKMQRAYFSVCFQNVRTENIRFAHDKRTNWVTHV